MPLLPVRNEPHTPYLNLVADHRSVAKVYQRLGHCEREGPQAGACERAATTTAVVAVGQDDAGAGVQRCMFLLLPVSMLYVVDIQPHHSHRRGLAPSWLQLLERRKTVACVGGRSRTGAGDKEGGMSGRCPALVCLVCVCVCDERVTADGGDDNEMCPRR